MKVHQASSRKAYIGTFIGLLGLIPVVGSADIATSRVDSHRFQVTRALAQSATKEATHTAFKWSKEVEKTHTPQMPSSSKPSTINRWANLGKAAETVASSDASEIRDEWALRSSSDLKGFRWGLRSSVDQNGFRWGLRSTVEQNGFRWGLRNSVNQNGFRWGLRNSENQQGFRWGLRSVNQQKGFRWGLRSESMQTGFRWGLRNVAAGRSFLLRNY